MPCLFRTNSGPSRCRTWRIPGSGPWRDQLPCALGESNRQWAPEGWDGEPDLRHSRGHHARQWHPGMTHLLGWPLGLWAPQEQILLLLCGLEGGDLDWGSDSPSSLCWVIPLHAWRLGGGPPSGEVHTARGQGVCAQGPRVWMCFSGRDFDFPSHLRCACMHWLLRKACCQEAGPVYLDTYG